MTKRLLDLFCKAGGAGEGYARAGFEVVGVDIDNQKRYPYEFHQASAFDFPLDGFDVVHASPPCQDHMASRGNQPLNGTRWMLNAIRERLAENFDGPVIIENVVGAVMPTYVTICGASLGCKTVDDDGTPLVLKRHRRFESNVTLLVPPCACVFFKDRGFKVGGVYGGASTDRTRAELYRRGYTPHLQQRKELMGIQWMTGDELNQAIPPVYTEMIGRQLIERL